MDLPAFVNCLPATKAAKTPTRCAGSQRSLPDPRGTAAAPLPGRVRTRRSAPPPRTGSRGPGARGPFRIRRSRAAPISIPAMCSMDLVFALTMMVPPGITDQSRRAPTCRPSEPYPFKSTMSAEWSVTPVSRTAWSNHAARRRGAQAGERNAWSRRKPRLRWLNQVNSRVRGCM